MKKVYLTLLTTIFALSAGARADGPNVGIYGVLNLDFETVDSFAATDPGKTNYLARQRLVSNSSNFGIKGSEDLGNGLKALAQLEVSLNPSSGILSPALRNSMLGLETPYGTFAYSKWDTPFKILNNPVEPFYGTGVGYMAAITDTIGLGATSMDSAAAGEGNAGAATASIGDATSFNRRQGGSIQYISPKISGVTARAMYSNNIDRNLIATGAPLSGAGNNPDLLGASVTYDEGMFVGGLAVEQHDDMLVNNVNPIIGGLKSFNSKDRGYKAVLGVRPMDTTMIGLIYTNLSYSLTDSAGASTYSRAAFALTATQKISDFTARAGFAMATDGTCALASGVACNISGLGGTLASLGGSYSLSKRTDVYLVASKVWNPNGTYNFIINGVNSLSTVNGQDPEALGLGMRHVF